MKRLSLISLLWLVAVVAAFFGGRASNRHEIAVAERKQLEREGQLADLLRIAAHSDEFARDLERQIEELSISRQNPMRAKELRKLVDFEGLTRTQVDWKDKETQIVSYLLSPSCFIEIGLIPSKRKADLVFSASFHWTAEREALRQTIAVQQISPSLDGLP